MIIRIPFSNGLFEKARENILYYGNSVKDSNIPKSITNDVGKDCTYNKRKGVIIGIEDCNQLDDYYYIVYLPDINNIAYSLCNSEELIIDQ